MVNARNANDKSVGCGTDAVHMLSIVMNWSLLMKNTWTVGSSAAGNCNGVNNAKLLLCWCCCIYGIRMA